MKIKVCQYFVGDNQKYLKCCKVVESINRDYCNLYGYDFKFDYIDKQEVINFFEQELKGNEIFYKVKYIKDKLDQQDCDYLVFIDADAAVSKPTLKIEDLIDDKHQLFLSRGNDKMQHISSLMRISDRLQNIFYRSQYEQPPYIERHNYTEILNEYNLYPDFERLSIGYELFNEGFMVIKNTVKMRKFFEETCYLLKVYFYDTYPKTQITLQGRAMGIMFMQNRYKDSYTFMYDQAQGGIANAFETKYDVEKTFILHNYGEALNLEQKTKQIEKLKNNKWWRKVTGKSDDYNYFVNNNSYVVNTNDINFSINNDIIDIK